jgi:hypothetical protein
VSRARRLERFGHLPVLDPEVSVLPAAQAKVWRLMADIPEPFVLYGGTALALRTGHRQSADFDFFSAEAFRPTALIEELTWLGSLTIDEASPDNLRVTTTAGVHLSFFGGLDLQSVAEPAIVKENGIVVASIFDLAGTKAKAILDRSEWRDYFDIATLLRAGLTLPEIIGYATTIFEPVFQFPAAVFLRALAWFGDGTVPDLPEIIKRELTDAVARAADSTFPTVHPYSRSILSAGGRVTEPPIVRDTA